jgi:hypothetical protein
LLDAADGLHGRKLFFAEIGNHHRNAFEAKLGLTASDENAHLPGEVLKVLRVGEIVVTFLDYDEIIEALGFGAILVGGFDRFLSGVIGLLFARSAAVEERKTSQRQGQR